MKHRAFWSAFLAVLLSIFVFESAMAQDIILAQNIYMKDTPADTGAEPNPDTGIMWISEDIWLRTDADPGYQSSAFPESAPSWTPLAHENPEYRDPKYGLPNYVYVRVHNTGPATTSGKERLRLYWATASSGLAWPAQWVDYVSTTDCGTRRLCGGEITKPRKNVLAATATERTDYINAILALGTVNFPDGVSYWHKQDDAHELGPSNRHGSPAFMPWHRELTNRYEVLLQEIDPKVKLLYWDWTTDPETGGFNTFTSTFMGASGRGTGAETSIGLPFVPLLSPNADGEADIFRELQAGPPPAEPDATLLGNDLFENFALQLQGRPNHFDTHIYLLTNFSARAAEDPYFFMLHANVDRLWAQWQRDPTKSYRLDRIDTYDNDKMDADIATITMGPWDGVAGHGTTMSPWTTTDGYIVAKTPQHASVASPPVYDTAPVVIPPLKQDEAIVLEIPWYPPNPADFALFGDQQGHVCLLARIETATSSPFGMNTLESEDVVANTRNNNNIVWKNVTVVDGFSGAARVASIFIRNPYGEKVAAGLRFGAAQTLLEPAASDFSRIVIDLEAELFKRWQAGGSHGQGVKAIGDGRLELTSPAAVLQDIALGPNETFAVDVQFELRKDYPLGGPRPKFDLIQTGAPGKTDAIVGGQRFEVDFSKIVLVRHGDSWRYLDDASNPGTKWLSPDFDDSRWKTGKTELGFGDNPARAIDGGPGDRRRITTYFRRAFQVGDPGFLRSLLLRLKRDDGAAVYLNGAEIHRVNLRSGAGPATPAARDVRGLEEEAFFAVPVKLELLRPGRNVIAVEIHQSSTISEDLSFDLELSANPAVTRFPPALAFASPPNGALIQTGETVTVDIDTLDTDGTISSVQLLADGKLVGTDTRAPFTFAWKGDSLGRHRLRAIASDNERQQTSTDATVTVVGNVPPVISVTTPSDGTVFNPGDVVLVHSQAADRLGKIVRVDFFVSDATLFLTPLRKVGTTAASPWSAEIKDLEPGMYMLTAVAVDDGGATNQSSPIHFTIGKEHAVHASHGHIRSKE